MQLYNQTFPDMSEADWDKLSRSHFERCKGAPATDAEWDRQRKFSELTSARVAANYAGNKTTHYLESDSSGGYRVYAPAEESRHYFSLQHWFVASRCGPYLLMKRKPA